jgi:flavin reductase (DIM6/NTAB) family NADH-FMN oxidoreductase RutF
MAPGATSDRSFQGEEHDAAKRVLAGLEFPMVVVTASDGQRRAGCLVGFHAQCSIEPLRYLVCISVANSTFAVAMAADTLAVHFLAPGDVELARLFGEQTGDEVDKFTLCEWTAGPSGVPILTLRGGWLAGPVISRVRGGDHVPMILEVRAARPPLQEGQLGSRMARQLHAGHPA